MLTRSWARLGRTRDWIRRRGTPSQAWSGASWALLVLWAFLLASFVVHMVLPQFSVGKLAGLVAIFGLLALISLGLLLLVGLLSKVSLRYRAALLLLLPPLVIFLPMVWAQRAWRSPRE
ncbi:hypothetical protein BH10PSE5_BH10PSE5_15210 [soil metagenome]